MELALAPDVARALRALARREGATLFAVLLAGFQALLARYTGSEDVLVGTAVAGRTRLETEGLIGFFVNTLVLRGDLSGDPTGRALVAQARERVLEAHAHQDVPFERLVEELRVERTRAHAPLFQAMFTFDGAAAAEAPRLAGLEVEPLRARLGREKFDLTLAMREDGERLAGELSYRTDLWEEAGMERLAGHLALLLEDVAREPGRRVAEVPLLRGAERERVLEAWNRTERPYPRGVCVHELFEAQAAARPDAPALVWDDLLLSYAGLDARANRLAHHLRGLGVGPETRVGVLLERGPELIVAILAVLKAGGCYVPLDPGYPAERLALMLADSRAAVLVGRGDLAFAAEAAELSVVDLDRAAEAVAREPDRAPQSGASPENLAYIVYTSGSTGRPKGVMVGHREVVQLAVETDYVRIQPGDRVAQASNASFDALTFEAWGALMNGATLVGIPRDVLLSASAFRETLRSQGITTLYQTTALLNQHSGEQGDVFASLREVLFGGQAADAASLRRLLRAGKPRRLLHVYGPTETTAWCSYEQVEHVAEDALTVTVGGPTGNARIYVLNRALEPEGVGIPGEAYVGGGGIVRGYLERPELTAERFLPDPFAAEPGARMYRTGDRMRWRAEGTLEFIGRVDEQVKIRGFRIEPGEVESAVAAHPGVREARVVVREDAPGEKRLVAYLVGEAGAEEVRAYLRASLPEYMVPAAFVALDALPLTPNGKLDVRALPAPEYASGDRYVAPRTPAEEVLAGIWADVLGLERVGVRDGFFELGGHSLLATRVVARARAALGVELPLRALFDAPTVEGLAQRADALLREGARARPAAPILAAPRDGSPLPLSFAQQRLWFIDRLEPGSAAYNLAFPLRLRGALDARALARALTEVVRRHEALRTVFRAAEGGPVQVVLPAGPLPLPAVDLGGLPEEAREAEALRLAAEDAERPFDLARGPLIRAALLRLGEGDSVLLGAMHHVAGDGWSMGVLFRETSALYAAFVAGEPSPLPEPPVQYADFTAWQRAHLTDAALEGQLGYWRERLAGMPPLLELPTDRPRPPVASDRGGAVGFALPAETAAALRALARREGATLFTVLLAGFQALLARYSGSEDVPVGTAVAGRTRLETEGLIGFFVNTLVLRGDLSGEPTGRAMVGQARERMLEAHVHQDLPFERLVEELRVERTRAHAPLFQAMLTFGPGAPGEGLRLGGVRAEVLAPRGTREKFDLTLGMGGEGDGLAGSLSYRTDLWEAATIGRMAGHFAALLEGLAREPERRVAELSLLDDAERARVLEEWNATERGYPAGECVHDLFAAQSARTPDAVAVSWRGASTTYAELDRRSARLANALRRRGVGPESRVGVCLPRTPELLAALLGVLRAGGAYVPLDPAYPRERLGWMLEDAAIDLVLTESGLAGRLPEGAADLLLLDRAELSAEPDAAPESGAGPENLSHVIFTSGSTGRPKGVMIRHSSTVVLLHWLRETVADEERASVLFSTSINFDVSVAEVFGTLCWGGKLVLVENALELASVAEPVVCASMVPSAAAELLRTGGIPRSVRALHLAGEALPAELARALHALGHVEHVRNLYGPTEDTTYSTWSRVERGAEEVRIGRAVAGTRAYVLDAELGPQPVGVPGEVYLAGAGLARGYAARPELTAERWVPDPFGAPGARMYRVMDRARWRPDGELEYLGRTDHQVKVRGFRIELGEVEAALGRHPAVREAVAVVREDAPGDRRIVAYVTGEGVSAAELRAHAAAHLPEYMVPSAFVPLGALPLTPSGKTDRRALPAPERGAAEQARQAPRTPAEEILAGIWADVLRLETVGVTDDFFALGGHSLLATQVAARAEAALGVDLPLRTIFEAPTVAGLAERVEAAVRAGAGVQAPPVVPTPRDGSPLPLSFAQQRLWFIDRLEPGRPTYNMPFSLRLRGPVDARALAAALREVVRRHEALRTVFRAVEGEPVQVVRSAAPFPLPTVDLGGLPEDAREAEALRLVAEDASRSFDLERGPLLRAALLRLGAEDAVLLGAMHHVVSDGWSMGVFFRELSALYAASAAGEPSPLPELPVQYADYAAWQRAHLAGEALEGQLGYWRERLAGMPPLLELPTDRPRPPVASDRGGAVAFALPTGTAAALRALARREGATLFTVLLAGFQALLARYAGTDDVPVGTAVAGRTRLETEGLIGFFVNTLVLRGDLSGGPTGRALVGQARGRMLEAHAHQDVPFERLVEELRVERTRAHAPLFQAMFTFTPAAPGDGLRLGEADVEPLVAQVAREKFDLTLGMGGEGDALAGGLSYRTDLWEAATVERMAGHFAALLEGLAREPERRAAELPLLDGAERRQVVEEWGHVPGARAPELTMHALVAAHAARAPGAVALVWGEERVSYAELVRRAGRLANHLRRLGVGPESRVGVCLERSPEMVVALLGILQAGGAYVPLDPAYPRERLAYMLADSGADVLVTVEPLLERCPRPAGAAVCLDRDAAAIARESDAPPAVEVSPEGLAFIVYTSGSTGEPKGAEVPHRAVPGVFLGVDYARFDAGETHLQHSSTSWDALVLELWGALLTGGRCVLYPGRTSEPGLLGEQVREHGVTTLWLTSAYFNLVVDTRPEILAGVRQVMTGGDAVSAPHLRRARELYPELRLVNGYGPSECTVFSTCHVVPRGFAGATVPIGRPVGDRRVHLLDAGGEPVPVGVPGELHVGGPAVGRGYRDRPELTAAKFVPDPFSPEPGARLYRTGDLARWRPDGTLEFVGRADFQVKIRGFRVEPGEVEATLAGHPDVREAAVVAREDAGGERRLVAYAVPEAGAEPAAEGLRAWLGERLPEYMVPAALVVLERLPLTSRGKTDRRALPAPEWGAAERAYVAPRTPAEEALAGIWAEVLGVDRVGVADDFFALGGHSLLAVRLLARVERATGVRLPLAVLFAAPTVEALAAELRRGRPEGEGSPLVPIRPEGEGTPLFLVHPVGGNVLAYAALARHLDPRRPVYALRSRGLAEGEAPAGSLDEMAADYLRALREVQPAGPYRLGGWSMGGVVAWEMARRLEAAGERVETLALVDSHLPALLGGPRPDDERTRVRIFAADLGLPPGELDPAGEDDGAGGSHLRRVLERAHAAGVLPADVDAGRMERLYAVFRGNLEALHAYPARPYGGAVLLLRAAERDPSAADTLGWERVAAGGVELRTVPGSHFTLVREPHAAALAAALEGRTADEHSPTEETGCR
ncbi:MAG: amino acid adenylation domain-containing protein [Gemmatimonadota bacterium]